MSKVENLIGGLHKLAHGGELDQEGFMKLGPMLGVDRAFYSFGMPNPSEGQESDESYVRRVYEQVSNPEDVGELEEYYETHSVEKRREIGRTINEVRRRT